MMIAENTQWCGDPPRDRANGRRVTLWSMAWAASMLVASAIASFEWFEGRGWAVVAATVSTLIGFGTLGAYRRLLQQADELRQKIELDALAIAMGVGVAGGLGYSMLTRSLRLGEPQLFVVIAAMLFAYCIGVIVGRRRYS